MAKRAHHWKHGWIPLDAFARAVARRHNREHAEYEAKRHGDAPKVSKAAQAAADKRKADHDWVMAERAKYEAAQKAKRAPAKPATPAAKPLVIHTGLSDAPKKAAPPRAATGGVRIADSGYGGTVTMSSPIEAHADVFYRDVAYAKATGKLDNVAEDYELDDFLSTIADFGNAKESSEKKAAAKRLLEHARQLGIAIPGQLAAGLQAKARG